MSEDLTQNLPNSFEQRVLAEFAAMRTDFAVVKRELTEQREMLTQVHTRVVSLEARVLSIDTRLTSLEDKVDTRLRETRPIWEGVLQRLTQIEKNLDTLTYHFKTMIREEFDLRSRVEKLEDDRHTV